jgi:hypothetical protein
MLHSKAHKKEKKEKKGKKSSSDQSVHAICKMIDQSDWNGGVLERYVTSSEHFMTIMRTMPMSSLDRIFPSIRTERDHHLKRRFFEFCIQQNSIIPVELFSFKVNGVPILYHAVTSHPGLRLVYEFLDDIPLSTWLISESRQYYEIISETYGDFLYGESILLIVKNKISKMIQEKKDKELLKQYMPLFKAIKEGHVITTEQEYVLVKREVIKGLSLPANVFLKEQLLALFIESDHDNNFGLLMQSDHQFLQSRIKGHSILSTIITYKAIKCLNILLSHNVSLFDRSNEEEDQYETDPFGLIRAVSADSPMILERLLQVPEVDINFEGHNGNTALHLAVLLDNTKLVEILMNHGANPYLENANGVSALESATLKNNMDILNLLSNPHGSLAIKNKKSL